MHRPAFTTRAACLFVFVLAGCGTPSTPHEPPAADAPPLVILISIDGLRPDYLQRGVTPHLNALADAGVRADAMRPSFPSSTFPNHYTLVTGLRPDEHGIVANTIEDRTIPGPRFRIDDFQTVIDPRWWDAAEPVWVTAERRGVRTATMFWPGSEAPIHGVRPSDWLRYDERVPANRRVDTVLDWLDRPAATRPRFITLYFDDVDTAGHHDGPDSWQVAHAVERVDRAIGRLRDGIAERHFRADVIVVSDHGMAQLSPDRVIRLDRIAPAGTYRWVLGGAYAGVEPIGDGEPALATALLATHDHLRCWRKADVPAALHYGHHPRVPSFFCLADPGWTIANGRPDGKRPSVGGHGYDNATPDMRATFVAAGPDFKPGTTMPIFDNVDVYPLVMRLLGLAPLPNDGTVATFAAVLR